MSEHRSRDYDDRVEREVNTFSITVLRYDRKNPRPNQRTPGEVIEEVEERIAAAKARTVSVRKWLGALILSLTSALVMALVTTWWPWLIRSMRG